MQPSRSDAQIQRDVQLEVNWVPSLRQEHLEVSVSRGVVTLTGTVGSVEQLREAERVVRRVPGVTRIADRISLRPGTGSDRRDDDLRRRAIESLRRNVRQPARAVTVLVSGGRITVNGEVEDRFQRDAVEFALASLFGAVGVTNRLTVRPPLDEQDVRLHIAEALRLRGDSVAEGIHVSSSGRTAILKGAVATWRERRVIEDAARAARGVSWVELHITVTG